MSPVAIPAWSANGVLPPINTAQPASTERSPYVVSLTEFVLRFGQTPERTKVLDGFMRYRAALSAVGLTNGFQWLDGSFLEDIEIIESRPPNDIDVVTFYRLPTGKSQGDLLAQAPELFATGAATNMKLKGSYSVDPYLVHLGSSAERLTQLSAYWYSMWSHRRNHIWKGFVQIDLAPIDDAAAMGILSNLSNPGVAP
jgi:hypothetical protein